MNTSTLWQATRQWLDREAPALPAALREAIEALYLAVEAGHVCIRVDDAARAEWEGSGWVGRPGDYRPFILEDSGRFYLARYHAHETAVAASLRTRAAQVLEPANPQALKHDLDALFPADPQDRQRLAALLAQFRALTLVSGGPGTGKTTTVVKMLALLQAQAGSKPLRILLAAPTGKAAQRLSESLRAAKQKLALPADVLAQIPETAQTLHRLLGAQGDTGRFRHDENSPLACDLLLVDEASMIDLALMQAVLAALPADARLVLLGDRDQLASVEAGSVFGDLCAGGGMSAELAATLASYGVEVQPDVATSVLGDCRVELTRSYRFAADSGIAALAGSARRGDAAAFLQTLAQGGEVGRTAAATLRAAVQSGYAAFRHAAATADVTAAFAAFQQFRVLCAHRQGVAGVEGLNALLDTGHPAWYAGRPVIVRANDYALRLFNGDIGLCLPTLDGLRVFFESAPGEFRALAPGRLPAHESAWAMTVHQSQGSEFDEVLLVLPDVVTPVLDRPLVYTAVTRAKARFSLCGNDGVIAAALATLPQRESGLAEKLRA
ncbi:MAG TPA: exodeoxyribonuclease V subunit alpha [Moraxellaceae bacterium]